MGIQNLILVFDLDNTLLLRDTAMVDCISACFNRPLSTTEQNVIRTKDEAGYSNRIEFCDWLSIFLQLPMDTSAVWNEIRNNIGYFVTLNQDVKDVLQQLHTKYQLVLLTNGGTENQLRKIKQTNLNTFFPPKHVFISEAIGYSKPEPNAFRLVEQQFSINSRFCMIGDHWKNDILGAINYGWQAIYLNPEVHNRTAINVRSITSLAQLIPLLHELKY